MTFQRILVYGPRGSGKSQAAQDFAQNKGGIYMPAQPHAHMTGITTTVAEEVALGLESSGLNRQTLHTRVEGIADALGIRELLHRHPLKLSAGQTQLVALAANLVLAAPALALDEPLLGLDADMRQKVLTAFSAYPGDLLWTSLRPERQEKEHATELHKQAGATTHPVRPASNLHLPARQGRSLHLTEVTTSPLPAPARTKNTHQSLGEPLTLSLNPGETLLLTGRNGSGKTTLLRTLAGLLAPASGTYLIDGAEPSKLAAHQRTELVQLAAQTTTHHFLTNSLSKEVSIGSAARSSPELRKTLLTNVLPGVAADTHPLDLLPAQQHLLTLITALLGAPSCLLLDEPTARTDQEGTHQTAELIKAHTQAGGSTIIATHDHLLLNLLGDNTQQLTL